jgi:NAD(P)-dependent dehydrogenase (short-subunit alcohol dehydrogenase family)
MQKTSALIIGASGGIGQALVQKLIDSEKYDKIYCVARGQVSSPIKGAEYKQMPEHTEQAVADYCQQLKVQGTVLSLAVCTVGVLHDTSTEGTAVAPEKRLEDLNAASLLHYFQTNTVIPSIWLKHAEPLLKGQHPAHLVFFTARVGSISDNQLGGWYGYRASKAALNMMIKTAQIELQRRAKNLALVSYHPGTVDTSLSKPFQHNVPSKKLFTPDFTATCLLKHLSDLAPENGPHYIDWDGKTIAW